ncbi:MAG: DegV family protein [Actinomycetota bacterium]
MTLGIITDSSAGLTEELVSQHHVTVLPITVHLADDDVRDDDPGAAGRIYDAISRREVVKSSAPIAPDYLNAIETSDADEILIVTPAVEFTTMFRHAEIAAETADKRCAVLDSRTAAAAQGLVVATASEEALSGRKLDEVVELAEHAARRVELVAKLESTGPLLASGRLPEAAAGVVQRMDLCPVFRFTYGTIVPCGIAQSNASALKRVAREWKRLEGPDAVRSVVFHAAAPDEANDLRSHLGGNEPVTGLSPSLGIHTGAGLVGVAWMRN